MKSLERESLTSSLSSDGSANDSFNSIDHEKESSKEKTFCWTQLLFFGPLILFLLLFIGSIAVFFFIQRTEQIKTNDVLKFDEQFPDGLKRFLSRNFHRSYFRRFSSTCL